MIPAVTAPFLASTVVMAGAGMAKMWRPDDTARALHVAGLPSHRRLVRLGAAAELVVAVAALAAPGRLSGALVAGAYAAFSVFVGLALVKRWPLSSCGCFGRPDTRPGYHHLVLDLGATACGALWVAASPGRLGRLFRASPWHGGPLVLVTVVIAALAYLVWTNPLGVRAT